MAEILKGEGSQQGQKERPERPRNPEISLDEVIGRNIGL